MISKFKGEARKTKKTLVSHFRSLCWSLNQSKSAHNPVTRGSHDSVASKLISASTFMLKAELMDVEMFDPSFSKSTNFTIQVWNSGTWEWGGVSNTFDLKHED